MELLEMKIIISKVKNTLDSICVIEFKVHLW